jgi:hypothetical protein
MASQGLNYWPLVRMKQHVTKRLAARWSVNASGLPLQQKKVQYNLAIFFLLVPSERTMQLCRRNAEQKDEIPSKSLLRHVNRDQHVSQIGLHPPHHKNTLQSTRETCLPLQKFGVHNAASSHRFHSVDMVPNMGCSTESDRPCPLRLPCSWFR